MVVVSSTLRRRLDGLVEKASSTCPSWRRTSPMQISTDSMPPGRRFLFLYFHLRLEVDFWEARRAQRLQRTASSSSMLPRRGQKTRESLFNI